jgi:hypothetical protein
MGFISKHLILLSLLFYVASCVEGEQKVVVSTGEGVTPTFEITQTPTNGSPPALPIPPNLAFTSTYCNNIFCPNNQFPFFRTTKAILEVQIDNPSNLPFTLEWSVNNGAPLIVVDPTQSSILLDGNNTLLFPILGFYTIQSTIKDSSGGLLSNLVWSVEIVGTNPTYGSFSPSPSPTPYVGSPFSSSNNATQTISANISNPSVVNFKNFWYLDGVLQGTPTDQAGPASVTFSFNPSQMTKGNHTVVAQLTDNPATSTVFNTATWSFEVTELPQFSTFSDPQLPSPAPFPNIEFGSNESVSLDPELIYNPGNATFTLYWEVDGAIDSTATFYGDQFNNDPDPFIISATDTNFQPGRHSVVAILVDESSSTSTVVDSASWNFTVVFPPPATLIAVNPATSTEIISVDSIPMNGTSPEGGFFIGPDTATSRGTPIVVVPGPPLASSDTFCVQVSDANGIGSPNPGAGVSVQYKYSNGANINAIPLQFDPAQFPPDPVCLDGTGASNFTDGVPTFSLTLTAPTAGVDRETTSISAEITDKISLQTIAVVTWDIAITENNTPPTLSVQTPTTFSTQTTVDVYQGQPYTFTFTIEDQDCYPASPTYINCYTSKFSFISPMGTTLLDGTGTYYPLGPATPTVPNCWRDFENSDPDKFSCTVTIPSNDGTAPIPATGTFKIIVAVENSSIWNYGFPAVGTTTFYDPVVGPYTLTWDLNVLEGNSGAPTLVNQKLSGAANPFTDSYVYSATPTIPNVAASTATEGDTIEFNLNVDDPEKDDYRVEIFYNTSASPTVYTPIPGYATSTVYPISTIPIQIAPFTLPFNLVTGVATATINFKVVLTDVPDSSTPLTSIPYYFPITVNNVNPIPVVVASSEKPATGTTGVVMQGFPYTMSADITDGSTPGEGDGLIWQWMINKNAADCSSKTALTWAEIDGATQGTAPLPQPQTASLTWSPPSLQISGIPSSTTFCFRNCIADDEFPPLTINNCSPTMAGPWVGAIKGSPADIPDLTTGTLGPDRGDTAVWADPVNDGDIYGIQVRGNTIFIFKNVYNLDTTVTQTAGKFTTMEGVPETASITEGAYDLSMTGNNNYIFVSYVFNSTYFPPFVTVPTNTVVRISKSNLSSVSYFFNNKIPAGVGQIVANNSAFWVPFINSSAGDTPFFFAGDGATAATTTINGTFGLPPVDEIESREQGGRLYMALKLNDGTVNLNSYDLAGLATPTLATTDDDILFPYYIPFSDMSLAVGTTPTNPNVFVAGIDTSKKALFYGVKPIASLGTAPPFVFNDLSTATPTYPKTYDPRGLNAVASTAPGEVLLGYFIEQALARSLPFVGMYILKSGGSKLNLSTQINQSGVNINSPRIFNSRDFALTNVIPKFEIGTAGAVTNENKKDTLWFRYWEFSTQRMVIVNIENETFSNSTPTTGNEAWSDAWFEQ